MMGISGLQHIRGVCRHGWHLSNNLISSINPPGSSACPGGQGYSSSCQHEQPASQHTHHVWVSTSQDIFSNLALEDWMYQNLDFQKQSWMLLWQNQPCIVIGRNQNPWAECNMRLARETGVSVARRQSGGGTVYHDLGNMCLSFFTSRDRYDRKFNLELVCATLKKYWNLDVSVGDRDDILLETRYKISGTASKLMRNRAYHHCTLLLEADKTKLEAFLHSQMKGIESRATESVRSDVKNLKEVDDTVTFTNLVPVMSQEYLLHQDVQKGEYCYVDPLNLERFPGLTDLRSTIADLEWIYLKTPKFTIRRSDPSIGVSLQLDVEKGKIKNVDVSCHEISNSDWLEHFKSTFVGTPFQSNNIRHMREHLKQGFGSCLSSEYLVQSLNNIIENS